jgi:hypothetical protein
MEQKNSKLVLLFTFVTAILFAMLLAGIEYLTNFGSTFLLMLIAVFIGNYMLKNLNYYTTLHKILAAVFAFVAFWVNIYTVMFIRTLIDMEATFQQAIIYTFSIDAVIAIIGNLQIFDYLIAIVMPIIAFQYLNRKSAF